MLRSNASRSLARAVTSRSSTARPAASAWQLRASAPTRALTLKSSTARPLTAYRPAVLALVRQASSSASETEAARWQRLQKETLQPTPEAVAVDSTTRTALEGQQGTPVEEDVDMAAGIRSDLKTIQETFTLRGVPREAMIVGLAGVVPYLATSLSTVFLAWDMNYMSHHGSGFLFDPKTAELLLHIIEPLQIGYGAVIISFLGAIHWGLEWAKFGGDFGYKRYWTGVLAPAIAWPTTLMPVEYALITQFLAFNWLYFTDSNAASRGMAPSWYGIYRFVLTFVVGASIVASLVGRGQISEMVGRPSNALSKVRELRAERDRYLAEEEQLREEAMASEGEGEGEDEE